MIACDPRVGEIERHEKTTGPIAVEGRKLLDLGSSEAGRDGRLRAPQVGLEQPRITIKRDAQRFCNASHSGSAVLELPLTSLPATFEARCAGQCIAVRVTEIAA